MYYSQDVIDSVLQGVDIVDVISPYVHLQKRQMTDRRKAAEGPYYILPTCFADDRAPEVLLRLAGLRGAVNTQFFKVKWKSLRYRIKSGDWVFNNVFKM
jgi:hypothetical protein